MREMQKADVNHIFLQIKSEHLSNLNRQTNENQINFIFCDAISIRIFPKRLYAGNY